MVSVAIPLLCWEEREKAKETRVRQHSNQMLFLRQMCWVWQKEVLQITCC